MVGIIAALGIELELLRQSLENEASRVISGRIYYTGFLYGRQVVMAVCGVGKVNAAVCAQTMCLEFKPELIINTGVAGALASGLAVGDVVVASCAVQHDMDTSAIGDPLGTLSVADKSLIRLPCDESIADALLSFAYELGANTRLGVVASGDQFIHSPERKDFLISEFGAVCCEMEGGAIAHVCALNATKCAIVRVMSDSADGGAPTDFGLFAPKAARLGAAIVRNFLSQKE
ncbi:MAG: 5'-methylthioadenosine/adenosylhomocysteine nucleosidase [Clostridium sp.]|jgi:adenosylhomocysteine nucleosidase|nr:5'-methylthioadenosine/adenosylhomocysteine nucleosidase [Clostridium sp.]